MTPDNFWGFFLFEFYEIQWFHIFMLNFHAVCSKHPNSWTALKYLCKGFTDVII